MKMTFQNWEKESLRIILEKVVCCSECEVTENAAGFGKSGRGRWQACSMAFKRFGERLRGEELPSR